MLNTSVVFALDVDSVLPESILAVDLDREEASRFQTHAVMGPTVDWVAH